MLKIGLTGGIGSGKSTVLQLFSILGVPIYDSDSRSKWLQQNDLEIIIRTKTLLGNDAYFLDNKLNKTFITQKIFADHKLLAAFNDIVHPKVTEDFLNWCKIHLTKKYIIKESALLFESGGNKNLDKIITVISPEILRIERIKKRDTHRTETEIKAIIKKQSTDEQKIKFSNYVLQNNESQLLVPQVINLHLSLLELHKKL